MKEIEAEKAVLDLKHLQLDTIHDKINIIEVSGGTTTLGICDIDFFNFYHCQVWNFKISNQSEWNRSTVVNFWKDQKQKQKSTKYITTERMQSVIPRKFH